MPHRALAGVVRRTSALGLIAFAAALSIIGGGCLPILVRDPRTHAGLEVGVASSLPFTGLESENGVRPVSSPLMGSITYGVGSDIVHRPSAEITLGAPFGAVFVPDLGVYVHAPRALTGGLDFGAGIRASTVFGWSMPFAALGLLNENGYAPFAMAGYVNHPDVNWLQSGDVRNAMLATLGYQLNTSRIFFQGARARTRDACLQESVCPPMSTSWSVSGGLSVQFGRKR